MAISTSHLFFVSLSNEVILMSRKTILIVEQDPAILRTLGEALKKQGFRILAATRALDGLDVTRKHSPDLIITELMLPDMTGRELATTLRTDSRFSNIPIVALIDADTDVEQRELSLVAGITGFIERPFNVDIIPIQIDFYLSGGEESVDDDDRLDEARGRYMQEFVNRLETRIRQLEQQNSELQRIDQMKDSFIQLTAHELRTPLTLITGYSRLLEDHPPLQKMRETDENISTLIDGLGESISRMQGIIEEILTVSRIMTSEIELNLAPVNMASIVKRVLSRYENALVERQLSLHWDEREWPISMRADGDLLQISIDNLLSNAIKYTPNLGNIYLSAQHTGSLLRFSVRDTGVGIDPKKHEAIFERFHIGGDVALHTTSKTAFGGGGLGLGLAICQGIVTAHGGKVWVESLGHDEQNLPGSEFIVVIPISSQKQSPEVGKIKRITRPLSK